VGAAWGLAPARRLLGRFLGGEGGRSTTVTAPLARRASAPPAVAPVAPTEAPAPVAAVVEAPQHHGALALARRVRPRAPITAEDPEDPIVGESRVLADALTALRQHHDPQRALRALDDYERRFPSGALAPEATAARIDALLALGRKGQALRRLETLSLDRLPRGTELRVLRGELRAGRGELGGALDDFDAVLASQDTGKAPGAIVERALNGRGSCRARLGDTAGARADLQESLRRFPNGPFAESARRALRD
jgi:hypothetical protein